MALRRREPLDIALATIKGETEPAEPFALERDRVVTIGRTGTIRLLDQLVSIHHARVLFDETRERYLIEDLGSATGTFVNGECVRGERRDLKLGMELRFGETTLRVERVARMTWLIPLFGGLSLAVCFIALLVFVAWMVRPEPPKDRLFWDRGILTPTGRERWVPVNDPYRWQWGLPLPLRLDNVSDYDFNGRDEMWIVDGTKAHEMVVTFDDKGEWVELGMLPGDCVVRGDNQSFPLVDCQGEQWQIMADEGEPPPGHYRPVFNEGPVVWYREVAAPPPTPPKVKGRKPKVPLAPPTPAPVPGADPSAIPGFGTLPKEGPLLVGRFGLKDQFQIRQFLSDRGFYSDKVHYLICEGAFEGIRAQVLTSDRRGVVELGIGCIEELRLEGNIYARPFAVAFTPAGLRALIDDVTTFYAGAPDGLFLADKWGPVWDALHADPGHFRGVVKLVGPAADASIKIPDLDPIPPLETRLSGLHPLVEVDRMLTPARLATTVTIPGPGVYEYATAGCETLRVEVDSYAAPGWLDGGTLLTVEQVGCEVQQSVLKAGYGAGKTWGKVGDLEVVVDVQVEPKIGSDVLRVRMSWR